MADIPGKVLGKAPKKQDSRNLMAARYLAEVFPPKYDFEKRRSPIPARTFGNTVYGDCTLASQANALARLERIEQRRTVLIPDQIVIFNYLQMNNGEDIGAYELDALKRWRTIGFTYRANRQYTIDAFTEIRPWNVSEMKAALWQFKVIKVCFALPIAWSTIEPQDGVWDVGDGPDYEVGSWGGHSMTADAYDEEGIWVIHTWYERPKSVRQKVTWAAVAKYCDEAYSVVDSLDAWRKKALFDVQQLKKDVKLVTA